MADPPPGGNPGAVQRSYTRPPLESAKIGFDYLHGLNV
jgi:hypothetical protein